MGPPCSPQPGIGILIWCPPAECKGVAYGQGWPPLKLGEQLERQPSLPGLQVQKHQVLWTPEGADGRWWQMGCDGFSYEEVGLGIWRNVTLDASETHKNPLPLSLPLPLPSSPSCQPPNTVPLSLISGLPPIGCPPFSVDPAPKRWKRTGVGT